MHGMDMLNDAKWKNIHQIILFGYGKQGQKIYKALKETFEIVAIVDNDKRKINTEADGVKIISFEEAKELLLKYKVIITAAEHYYQPIKAQLLSAGLTEYDDFVMYQQFVSEWFYKYKNKIFAVKTDIPVTVSCSLKCKNCMVFAPYWKNKKDFELGRILQSIDVFFRHVDFVLDMDIIGGEPFLYKELDSVIEYIGENYRSQIGYLGIITNGTIIPDGRVLELIKKYSAGVSISDYSSEVNYRDKVDMLCRRLEENGILYKRNEDIDWYDFGRPDKTSCTAGEKQTRERPDYNRMKECNTICHILFDSKIYYCGVAWAAEKAGLFAEDPDGSLDLLNIKDEKSRQILDLYTGKIPPGGGRFCKVCGGFGNGNKVPAGEQLSD